MRVHAIHRRTAIVLMGLFSYGATKDASTPPVAGESATQRTIVTGGIEWPPVFQTYTEYEQALTDAIRDEPAFGDWLRTYRNVNHLISYKDYMEQAAAEDGKYDTRHEVNTNAVWNYFSSRHRSSSGVDNEWMAMLKSTGMYGSTNLPSMWSLSVEELKTIYVNVVSQRMAADHAKRALARLHYDASLEVYEDAKRKHEETFKAYKIAKKAYDDAVHGGYGGYMHMPPQPPALPIALLEERALKVIMSKE